METGAVKLLDAALYRRGVFVVALARWLSLALAALAFSVVWDAPGVRPQAALAVAVGYMAVQLGSGAGLGRYPRRNWAKAALDLVDAAAVALGAAFSGSFGSPIWLLLYPHVVAVSVRRGLAYAMAFGALDAVIITVLAWRSDQPLGALHALALLFCAFMGGSTSSYLHAVQNKLARVNEELGAANRQLSDTVGAQHSAQRQQELALGRLRASEERYRRLLERAQDGVLVIQDGRVAYANQVFAAMAGEAPEDLRGRDFRLLVPPEDRARIDERYAAWQQSGVASGNLECRVRRADGSTLLASVRAGAVEFEERRSIIATVRDITRQRGLEQDLKAHAERLAGINELANAVDLNLTVEDVVRVVVEGAPRLLAFDQLTIALADETGAAVEVMSVAEGRACRRQLGLGRDQLPWAFGGPFAWVGPPAAAPSHAESLLGGEVGSLATVPLLFKGRVIGSLNLGRGRPQPFTGFDLATLEPLARHIASALANARLLDDVRRRGQERESLLDVGRSISERLDLVEVLPLITRSVNRVMGTQHCLLLLRFGDRLHVAAQEGFEPDVLEMIGSLRVGESLSGWVAREGQALALEDFRADPRAGFLETAERYGYRSLLCVPLKRADEVLGTLEVVTKERRCFGPEDQALMMSFAAQASVAIENARLFEEAHQRLTELTEANRRLEELHRLRQQYLRNVSHEFRTPLTVIKGYAEFLQESPPAADALREVLGIVLESSDRLIDMVDTLIDVSRIEQEEEPEKLLQVQSLDLAELARGSVESFRWAAARKNIAFDLKFPEGTLVLHGDQGLLLQAVRKLLDNALKYSPSNSRVVLRGGEEDGGLWLEVEDSGIGIATEHQGRIFEKFYTVDGSLTRRVGGTGVGLYLVREIVRLHQGSVSVRSRLGQGSVFSVRLPRKLQGTWRPAPVFATRTIT